MCCICIKILSKVLKKIFNYSNERKVIKKFKETNSVFIHIPKCGGMSINEALYDDQRWGHRTYSYYEKKIGKSIKSMFTFTFVRHPGTRLFSAYNFLMKGGMNSSDFNFTQNHLRQYKSFEDFVINGLREKDIINWVHFRPQTYWLCSSVGTIDVSFIGYFENYASDFKAICSELGCVAQLSHRNKTKGSPTFDYAILPKHVRQVIESVYREDFENFYSGI